MGISSFVSHFSFNTFILTVVCDSPTSSYLSPSLPLFSSQNRDLFSCDEKAVVLEGVGGLSSQIRNIVEIIHLALRNPEIYERYALSPPKVNFLFI
jgi:ATP-dependent 26S proteasome regulatory subunit